MMAAMMLPSAVPALLSIDGAANRRPGARLASPVLFACSYLGVWTAVGVGAFLTYQAVRGAHPSFLEPHRAGTTLAGAVAAAAGLYELTPLKRACLARCRARTSPTLIKPLRAGLRYAGRCVGCSAGLMLVLFAVGVMSALWMLVLAVLVFVEKVPAVGTHLVAPVAAMLIALGAWIVFAPSSVPGLTLPM